MITYSKAQSQKLLKLSEKKHLPDIGKKAEWITFYDLGLSINQMRELYPDLFYAKMGTGWYGEEGFATQMAEPCMRTICTEAVGGSCYKTWDEQQKLCGKDEYVPMVREVITMILLHFLSTGERLFKRYCVRCIDKDSDGNRVYVGHFGSDGFSVGSYPDGDRLGFLGLAAAARKS